MCVPVNASDNCSTEFSQFIGLSSQFQMAWKYNRWTRTVILPPAYASTDRMGQEYGDFAKIEMRLCCITETCNVFDTICRGL